MAQGHGKTARGDRHRIEGARAFSPAANFWTKCPEKGAWSVRTAAGFNNVAVVG
jgi:hypothetical protein